VTHEYAGDVKETGKYLAYQEPLCVPFEEYQYEIWVVDSVCVDLDV
jgi:hypothetical protein